MRFGVDICRSGKLWLAKPTVAQLRKLYIELLLYHEVGHHIDLSSGRVSKAISKQAEEYANQYAIQKSTTATHIFNRLTKRSAVVEN